MERSEELRLSLHSRANLGEVFFFYFLMLLVCRFPPVLCSYFYVCSLHFVSSRYSFQYLKCPSFCVIHFFVSCEVTIDFLLSYVLKLIIYR